MMGKAHRCTLESSLWSGTTDSITILLEEASHWDNDIRVLQNKVTIEICESEEGLNIMDTVWMECYFMLVLGWITVDS